MEIIIVLITMDMVTTIMIRKSTSMVMIVKDTNMGPVIKSMSIKNTSMNLKNINMAIIVKDINTIIKSKIIHPKKILTITIMSMIMESAKEVMIINISTAQNLLKKMSIKQKKKIQKKNLKLK
jgi:hypothetical protein